MTLPSSGHQTRAVTFGCMAKGRGVSSRASSIISAKILVGNALSSGHLAKAVSSSSRLVAKKCKQKKDKAIMAWKNCIHDGYNSPPTKAPTDDTSPRSNYNQTSLEPYHSLYMFWITPCRNFPVLVGVDPIGYPLVALTLYGGYV